MKTQEQIKAEIKRFQGLKNQYPTDSTIQFSLRALEWVLSGSDCPHCGLGPVNQTFKHGDLLVNDDGDPEYRDVAIYKCDRCGKYHADVENFEPNC